ncbi:hypothetical protein QYS49_15850 [Marivirga salinae]|uniref:DUF4843 domain-containing protein n=1 Tax=Marivirga salinarum TaxID=3059078 RepID=A0AA49GFJ5_9BACT|nr:hypothetical protein [Marivirga sp. BDSF4-3]WKK78367.2 hypothetical protein QYS49_15850 [Marivirga sp. BDSF4-3]
MKTINYIFLALFIGLVSSCVEPVDLVTGETKEGALLSLSGSGALSGAPEVDVPIENAKISFQRTILNYNVSVASNAEIVDQLIVSKTYGDQVVEIGTFSVEEGVALQLSTLSEFLQGFSGVTADDLRVGDQIVFKTEMVLNDGRQVIDNSATLAVNVSCLADLTGIYLVTNSWCSPSFEAEITQNPDGSYHLTVADGGGLSRCTTNDALNNAGTIVEQCGEILPSTALDYGTDGGYGIGDITGGSWDAQNGILTMQHIQEFTPNWPSEWESTYVRQ